MSLRIMTLKNYALHCLFKTFNYFIQIISLKNWVEDCLVLFVGVNCYEFQAEGADYDAEVVDVIIVFKMHISPYQYGVAYIHFLMNIQILICDAVIMLQHHIL